MVRAKALIVAGALAVSAIASQPAAAPKHSAQATDTAARVESLKRGLDEHLADYPSARFRDVKMSDDGAVCGFVNSKNRVGGYAGWAQFYAIPMAGRSAVVMVADNAVNSDVAETSCSQITAWRPGDLTARVTYKGK